MGVTFLASRCPTQGLDAAGPVLALNIMRGLEWLVKKVAYSIISCSSLTGGR